MIPAAPKVPSFLLEALEAPLSPLDRLPRGLWLSALAHSLGALAPRLEGVEALRAALLRGEVPRPPGPWPDPLLARGLELAVGATGLARYCEADEAIADLVLRSLLWHLDRIVDYVDRGAGWEEASALALEAFAEDWRERCGELAEVVDVLGSLGDLVKNTRWDLLRGLLKSSGWKQVLRIRRLLERLPELSRLIRALGRARRTEVPDASHPLEIQVMDPASVLRMEARTVRVPDLPGQTRGVCRSSRVARMLPGEAVLLNHPLLRLVWHARHAERTLLTYEDDDRLQEIHPREAPALRPSPRRVPDRRLERGPMLVCVDTSGSMQGGAEAVAKAVVLEAVRAAHAQERACHVFAFSGPGDVVDLELAMDGDGVERLTRFIGQSFGGGTDISGPLERAVERLGAEGWRLADLLIASDGEFGATPEAAAAVARAKQERGLKVQGILIGDRETIGMLELADDVFWVKDWRRFGGWEADSPVHSKSLTATYFPGALRSPARHAATVGGDVASWAVLHPAKATAGGATATAGIPGSGAAEGPSARPGPSQRGDPDGEPPLGDQGP